MAAPVSEPALRSMVTTPDIMFSATDQPTRPLMVTSGPSMSPQANQPGLPSKWMRQRLRIPTASECLDAGLSTVTSVTPSL